MAERTLIAKVERDEENEGIFFICSPAVGIADSAPRPGIFMNPLDRVLTMKILNRRYALRLPRDTQGRVVEVLIPDRYSPLNYATPIARLDPRALSEEASGAATAAMGAGGERLEQAGSDLIAVTTPSEGIFYRRPSPDSPSYVEVGSEVQSGSVLGLVEVMKCFNQITYGGAGMPPRGVVAEILADDAAEVRFGQPLFRVRPLT